MVKGKNNIRFVTLFLEAEAVHLKKEIGMIPHILQRDFGMDSLLVYRPGGKQAVLPSQAGRNIRKLGCHRLPGWLVALGYVLKYARDTDVLNLYHHSRQTLLLGWCYKKRNPAGILYIKMDANPAYLEQLPHHRSFSRNVRVWNRFFNSYADIVSTESRLAAALLSQYYPALKDKLLQVPNGVDEQLLRVPAPDTFEEKERVILTAGRIGAPEKNHRMLLSALARIDLKGWKVVFAGPVQPGFDAELTSFFETHPALRSQLLFTGALEQELYEWYRKARVFVLTSSRENFPLVLPEALYYGCYIVSTDTGCIREILEDGRSGSLVQNEDELVASLQGLIDRPEAMSSFFPDRKQKAVSTYSWNAIVSGLNKRIRELVKRKQL